MIALTTPLMPGLPIGMPQGGVSLGMTSEFALALAQMTAPAGVVAPQIAAAPPGVPVLAPVTPKRQDAAVPGKILPEAIDVDAATEVFPAPAESNLADAVTLSPSEPLDIPPPRAAAPVPSEAILPVALPEAVVTSANASPPARGPDPNTREQHPGSAPVPLMAIPLETAVDQPQDTANPVAAPVLKAKRGKPAPSSASMATPLVSPVAIADLPVVAGNDAARGAPQSAVRHDRPVAEPATTVPASVIESATVPFAPSVPVPEVAPTVIAHVELAPTAPTSAVKQAAVMPSAMPDGIASREGSPRQPAMSPIVPIDAQPMPLHASPVEAEPMVTRAAPIDTVTVPEKAVGADPRVTRPSATVATASAILDRSPDTAPTAPAPLSRPAEKHADVTTIAPPLVRSSRPNAMRAPQDAPQAVALPATAVPDSTAMSNRVAPPITPAPVPRVAATIPTELPEPISDVRATPAKVAVPNAAAPNAAAPNVLVTVVAPGDAPRTVVPPASPPPAAFDADPAITPIQIAAASPSVPMAPVSVPADTVIVELGAPRAEPTAQPARPAASAPLAQPAQPVQPAIQPAAQVFAAAIFAADPAPRAAPRSRAGDPGEPLPIESVLPGAHAAQPVAIATTAEVKGPPLDLTRHDWMASMIDRIETIQGEGGARETRIRLAPDALGTIDLAIRHDERGELKIHINAEAPQARAILAEAAPRLADMAEARGLKLAGASVDSGGMHGDTARRDAERPSPSQPARPASAFAANDVADDIFTDSRIA